MMRTARTILCLLSVFAATALCVALARAGGPIVKQQAVVLPQGVVVTQYAVPVAVPQYTHTVAPQSYVTYGVPQQTESTATVESLTAEIAALRRALEESGQIRPQALPSLVTQSCGKCHSGPEAKGGFDLSDHAKLSSADRLKAINRMLADDPKQRMPPPASGHDIDAATLGRLIQEFSVVSPVPKESAP